MCYVMVNHILYVYNTLEYWPIYWRPCTIEPSFGGGGGGGGGV